MITNKNIHAVLKRVEKEVTQHAPPVVTLVATMNKDPYRVLIATLISLRTKDDVTAQASKKLFARASTPEKMVKLPLIIIEQAIYPAGFYKTKAQTIKNVSAKLIEEYNGRVPDEINELLTFKGIGRKTANLVLIEGYNKPAMCVDTHVHRISNRWGYVKTKTPDETEQALREKLPKQHWRKYNEYLVGFGQHRCQPVSPKCSTCTIKTFCPRKGVTTSR